MAYSEEVKEYAKQLFLTVDKNGGHKYSSRAIEKELPKKFPDLKKFPSYKTIQDWANGKEKGRKTWNKIWDEGQRHGVKEATEELEKDITSDESIGLQVDTITRQRAERAIKLGELVTNKLENKEQLENIDIKALQTSELIFNNLNLEAIEEDQKGGWDDLVDALKETRKEEN